MNLDSKPLYKEYLEEIRSWDWATKLLYFLLMVALFFIGRWCGSLLEAQMTFPVPTLQNNIPIKEHPFYQYLCEHYTKHDKVEHTSKIEAYLASLGFVEGKEEIVDGDYLFRAVPIDRKD